MTTKEEIKPFTETGEASIWKTVDPDETAWKEHPVAFPTEFVAAHKTLPLGTYVKVTHGDKSCVVRIVDRGPYVAGRIIDLMQAPANAIGITDEAGIGEVTIEVCEPS
jgi:rare lipoprotein A (peptidoglycan hydrolase)